MTPLSMVVSFLSSVEGLEVTPDVVPHQLLGQGFLQQSIERSQLLRREFGQRQRQVIGNGPFGVERTGKRQLMKRVGISKRLYRRWWDIDGEGTLQGCPLRRRPWEAELASQVLDPLRPLLRRGFLEAPIAM